MSAFALVLCTLGSGCSEPSNELDLRMESAFVSEPLGGCLLATSTEVSSRTERLAFAASEDGRLTGLNLEDGSPARSYLLPRPPGQEVSLAATPHSRS
ncbi:MAG TPA: hypothetical protein VEY30_13575 [Myxococcaceae bacterium]|nr:hypothetical protein [Myxococcaceae bacterium]